MRALLVLNIFSAPVVSLAPSVSSIIQDLGLEENLVGRTDYCDLPNIASIGGFINPNLERIVTLKPDVVIGTSDQTPTLESLSQLGVRTLVVDHTSLGGVIKSYSEISSAIEPEKNSKAAQKGFLKRLSKYKGRQTGTKVLYLMSGDSLYLACGGSYFDSLAKYLGQENACTLDRPYTKVSLESLLGFEFDYLVQLDSSQGLNLGKPVLVLSSPKHQIPGPAVLETFSQISSFDHRAAPWR